MNRDREQELKLLLLERKQGEYQSLLQEYLQLHREALLDRLEMQEDPVLRGKSLKCKELLQLFS